MKSSLEHFFMDCNDPVAVSELITSLAAGTVMKVDRIPQSILPHVVLLTTIGLRRYNQQIIDDYGYLLQRTLDVWKEPDFTHRVFWHPQLNLVWYICERGPRGEYFLDDCYETQYMFPIYEELVNADLDQLFPAENAQRKTRARAQTA
jgi:hypothetical protein